MTQQQETPQNNDDYKAILAQPIADYVEDVYKRGLLPILEQPGEYFLHLPIELQLNLLEMHGTFAKLMHQVTWWCNLYGIDMQKIYSDLVDQMDDQKAEMEKDRINKK